MYRLSFIMIWAFALSGAAIADVLVPLDSTDGISKTWGGRDTAHTLSIARGDRMTTDGGGALQLEGTSGVAEGNHYFGAMISLSDPVDLTDRCLILDARTSTPECRAFYVRAYNRGDTDPSFSFHSWNGLLREQWQTFHMQEGLCPEGLSWESHMVEDRRPTNVDRIEIIVGTHEDDTALLALFDNIRTGPRIGTLRDLDDVKPIIRETVLVEDGEPAAVVLHPPGEAGTAAARQLVTRILEHTGVTLPMKPGTPGDREPSQTAIFLGTVDTNPAMLLLYARKLTPVDSVCPGAGGALVHTVYDPFGNQANAIVVGAPDAAGLKRGVEMLAGHVTEQPEGDDLALPHLFDRAYSEAFIEVCGWADDTPPPDRLERGLEQGQRALDRGRHCSVAGVLATVADRYRYNGQSVEAKLFVQLWDLYQKSAVADPRKFGGPWGFDSDFMSKTVVPGWDLLEEDPALTDAERLATTKAMGRWLAEAVVPSCAGAARSSHVPHNHQTFPALGTLFAGLYFTNHYDLIEGDVWLEIADAIFQRQAGYFKPYEDCNGYQWLTNGHLLWYTVARPDDTVYKNGNAKRIIDFCIGNMDNLGYQVPYGDTGSWACWNSEMICLDIMAFATGDAKARWAANFKREVKKTRLQSGNFFQLADAPRPEVYNGVIAWPLEPQYYHTFHQAPRPPLEMCFDKVSFRQEMDPGALYLLLDGLSNGGHKHYDGNSIPRLTQFERIWLADNDYYKSPLKYHNSLLVIADGASAVIPAYTQLIGAGESSRFGYSRTRVEQYAGTDWERTIVWLKDTQDVVVLDRLTALEDNEYQFRLLWHGVGAARMSDDGMYLTQNGPDMWIQVAQGPELSLHNDHDLGSNWNGYPHADPVVRSMTANASVRLNRGESYLFATAFHGSSDGSESAWNMGFVDGLPGVVLRTPARDTAIGLGAVTMDTVDGRFSTDADVLVADMGGLSLLGATDAELEGDHFFMAAEPRSVDLPEIETSSAVANLPLAPPRENLTTSTDAPAHDIAWDAAPSPSRIILTGNHGLPGAAREFATISASPAPAEANVFSAGSANHVAALTDGTWNSTGDSVMFEPDATVGVTIEFQAPVTLEQVQWKQWWATTSSKNTAYLLEKAVLEGSADGATGNMNEIAALTEPGSHPDWGSPVTFTLDGQNKRVQAIRLTLTPQPGSAIYLGEIIASGQTEGGDIARVPYTITAMASARLAPAPAEPAVVVATAQGDLFAYDAAGKRLWDRHFPARLNDVGAVDLDGDGIDELMLARQDHIVATLTHDGETIWTQELDYYRKAPHVNLVRSGDLNGDGVPEVIAGGNNWRFYAFDAQGNELWNYESVHPSRSGAVADLDADGQAEVICGTHYHYMTVLKPDGTRKWKANFGPICWDVATGEFDGDGTRGVLCGAGDGGIYMFGPNGQRRLALKTGDEVRDVATADLDADGQDEALAASYSHNVYCFDGQGTRQWRLDLGERVTCLTPVNTDDRTLVVAGTEGGVVVTIDKTGAVLAKSVLPSGVTGLTALGSHVVVATENGHVRLLEVAR